MKEEPRKRRIARENEKSTEGGSFAVISDFNSAGADSVIVYAHSA